MGLGSHDAQSSPSSYYWAPVLEYPRLSGYTLQTLPSKPRTTDLRPWLWGAALRGSPEHSPRTIVFGVWAEIVRGLSSHSRAGRSVVRGKQPDTNDPILYNPEVE